MIRRLLICALFGLAACGGGETAAPVETPTPAPTASATPAGTATDGECSAASVDPDLQAEVVPDPVQEKRVAIARAAAECDWERLAELAGPDLEYSFGDGGDPIAFWQQQESDDRGPDPMRFLVHLLERPRGTVEGQEGTIYVWPSAFAYDSWDDVPEVHREALKPLYDEQDFEDFARFGGYIGYRVGIAEDGTWLFFIAGD